MSSLFARIAAFLSLILVLTLIAVTAGAERAAAPPSAAFTDAGAVFPGVVLGEPEWGDYDADGDLDFAVTGGGAGGVLVTKIFRNDAGTFTDTGAGVIAGVFSALEWGDYDRDGDLDLVINGTAAAPAGPFTRVYRNDAGVFTDIGAGFVQCTDGSVQWGDLEGDGDLDLLIAGYDATSTQQTKIYRNDAGTFGDTGAVLPGISLGMAKWADMDSDGDLDVALTGVGASGLIGKIFRNDGGSFADTGVVLTPLALSTVSWGDYNSDGRPDLVMSGVDGVSPAPLTKIYRNDGSTFTDIAAAVPGVADGETAWGDYDADGDLDLAISGTSPTGPLNAVYNNNAGAFSDFGTGIVGTTIGSLAWGDYNADGKLDLLVTGQEAGGSVTKIYRNDMPAANAVPNAPTGLLATRDSTGAITFSWKAAIDSNGPAGALTYNFKVARDGGELYTPMASATTGKRLVVKPGNMGARMKVTLNGLPNASYTWGVQAIDSSYAGSTFATQTFKLPVGFGPVTLSRKQIKACGKPAFIVVKGRLAPATSSVTKITLQKRVGKKGAWKSYKSVKTKVSGTFTFKKVGKGMKTSIWVRVTAKIAGRKIASKPQLLKINTC